MEIKRSGSQPSAKGPAQWFTGTCACARCRRERHIRARRPDGLAHAPAGPDADRDVRGRSRPAMGWTGGRDSSGRRHLVPARREALAWRSADDGDDAHRDSGEARWEARGLAGARHGRAVRRTSEPLTASPTGSSQHRSLATRFRVAAGVPRTIPHRETQPLSVSIAGRRSDNFSKSQRFRLPIDLIKAFGFVLRDDLLQCFHRHRQRRSIHHRLRKAGKAIERRPGLWCPQVRTDNAF
jgi:hypothetical protein